MTLPATQGNYTSIIQFANYFIRSYCLVLYFGAESTSPFSVLVDLKHEMYAYFSAYSS